MTWEYTDLGLDDLDVIWCSPPCTLYSIARSKAKTPRDLEGADAIVQRCLDIIAYWRPRYWFIENPQTGLLKTRSVVQELDYKDVDYCMYQDLFLYCKRTRFWINCAFIPRPLCTHTSHPMTAQKGSSRRAGHLIQDDNCSLQTLHAVPVNLTSELMHYTNEA